MNRSAKGFAIAWVVATSMVLGTGCAAEDGDANGESTETTADEAEALATVALGADTNGSTLDIGFARTRGVGFVARYLSFDGSHPGLTREEASRFRAANMPLVAVWEVGQHRSVEKGSIGGEYAAGVDDGRQANAQLAKVGAGGKPIYFTVDFDVTPEYWSRKTKDSKTGKVIEHGDLIVSYFNGINSVLGVHRTGAYGTYTTIHGLFDSNKIGYGWQQTFGDRKNHIDPRAQLRQYDIYADQTGWGVSGAGALDLDRAVKKDFGQW
jgi:hypothetical protein